MTRRLVILCILVLLLPTLAAQAQLGQPPQIDLALADLSQRVGRTLTLNDLNDWSWAQASYPDTSLGCPQSDAMYAQVVTVGYQFTLVYQGVSYDYRVSNDGNIVFLCGQQDASAPVTPTALNPGEIDQLAVCPNPEAGFVYPTSRLIAGMQARVAPAAANNLRQDADRDSAQVGEIPAGALFDITAGPLCGDGLVWWQVNYEGTVGWTAEGDFDGYWLEPAPGRALPANLLTIDADGASFVAELSQVEGNLAPRLALAPGGQTVTVPGGSGLRGLWFYNLAALDQPPTFQTTGRSYSAAAYGPDGTLLLLGANDGWFELRDTSTQRVRWEDYSHTPVVSAVAYSADGTLLATAGERAVKNINVAPENAVLVWDSGTLGLKAVLPGHLALVNALAFSPDGALIASASGVSMGSPQTDNTVRLWNPATGAAVATLEGHTAPVRDVAFSPDGALIASVDMSGAVIVWDAQTREEVRTLQGSPAVTLAFSPDGALLAVAGGDPNAPAPDFSIVLWDVAEGTELARLAGHTATVGDLAFSADGRVLISAGDDRTLRFWGLTAAG